MTNNIEKKCKNKTVKMKKTKQQQKQQQQQQQQQKNKKTKQNLIFFLVSFGRFTKQIFFQFWQVYLKKNKHIKNENKEKMIVTC